MAYRPRKIRAGILLFLRVPLESTNYGNTLGTRVFQLWHVDMPYEETVEFFKRNTPENPNPGHNFKWQRELNENEYGWCWENKPGDSEY